MEHKGNKVKFPAFHNPEDIAEAKALARKRSKGGQEVSCGEIIRKALREYLDRHMI